ncbi:IS1595 family transposase [Methanothrix sp.]|uniref:IS1595 family transposase n=1 Tax=Methanothrix sp. TaxID=90426 RepID=UPI00338F25A1
MYCGSEHVVRTGRWRDTPNQRYHCRSCDKWFNDKTGTIFQDTRLPLRVWFFVAFMLQFKVSILEISKTVGINYKSAFHMVKRLRSTVYGKNISDKLRGVVEMDEAYVKAGSKGKKELNREARKRGLKTKGRGTYDTDKVPVIAIVERGGGLSIQPHRNVKSKVVLKRYLRDIDPDAVVYTDDYVSYNILPDDKHESVNHAIGEYSKGGGVHINTVEAEFSIYRPWMATFRGVSKKNLYLYTAHYQFIRLNREMNPVGRMLAMVKLLRILWLDTIFCHKFVINN